MAAPYACTGLSSKGKATSAETAFPFVSLLRHLELGALNLGAILFGGLGEALTLARVLTLACVRRRLAGAVTFATTQWPMASSAALADGAETAPASSMAAATAASDAPDVVEIFIAFSPLVS
jgi:hypothetical protein